MAKEIRKDFILDENGDFPLEDTVVGGVYLDTPYGNSDPQHILDLLQYGYGHLKKEPNVGFLMSNYLNSEFNLQSVYNSLEDTMKKDDYHIRVGVLNPVSGGGFIIDTSYISRQ